MLNNSTVGNNAPGLDAYPLLYDRTGAFLETSVGTVPVMHLPMLPSGASPPIAVSNVNITSGITPAGAPPGGVGHVLAMNLETPRSHLVNQLWTVTFEGALPRLGIVAAELRAKAESGNPGLYDAGARYCDGGVQSYQAQLLEMSEADARKSADRIAIGNLLADKESDYWTREDTLCSYDECSGAFGDVDTPGGRDFMIVEAYQDRLLLEDQAISTGADPATRLGLAKCCFPTLITYFVRPSNQWVVVGEASGFLHHVVADPETGVCRKSCDPTKVLMNGRAPRAESALRTQPVLDSHPDVFRNPMFRFVLIDGAGTDPTSMDDPDRPQRDMQLQFGTVGAFTPLSISLVTNNRNVAPMAITLVSPTGELAITDGSLQGVMMINLSSASVGRQFF
ncbi:MAG: hypothetical protein R3F14_18785 [Polyangiaceae bacterium]